MYSPRESQKSKDNHGVEETDQVATATHFSKKIKIYPPKKALLSTGQIGEELTQRGEEGDILTKKQTNIKKTQSFNVKRNEKTRKFNARQRWSKLNNVLRTISLLQRHRTKIINDPVSHSTIQLKST